MNYRQFVSSTFHKLPASMAATEKMKKIGQLWRESHGNLGPATPKRYKGRPRKNIQGSGIFGSIGDAVDGVSGLIGLGMKKKGRGRPRKHAKGSGILSSALGMMGMGMEEEPQEQMHGGGLGRKKLHKRVKGGAYVGGDLNQAEGSGMLSGLASMVGLGMTKKHQKHRANLHKMLEYAYQCGKKEHKVKGGSFWDFDRALDGIKTGFNMVVNPAISAAQTLIPLAKSVGAF